MAGECGLLQAHATNGATAPARKRRGAQALGPFPEIGHKVEVLSNDTGFKGSRFSGTLIGKVETGFFVRYDSLVTEDGKPLVEKVGINEVRPAPPVLNVEDFKSGDCVEAYHNDGWWAGTITRVLKDGKSYLVYFTESAEEHEYAKCLLRPKQHWTGIRWIRAHHSAQLCAENGALDATENILPPDKNIDDHADQDKLCSRRHLEISAYAAVLKAILCQGAFFTWEQEKVITDVRSLLRIDNDMHIFQLNRVKTYAHSCSCVECQSVQTNGGSSV